MPSRKELRNHISYITSNQFAAQLPLHKTNYGGVEAAQITLQALITHHGLLVVDSLLTKINASETNISSVQMRSMMRAVYMHRPFHNEYTYNLVCNINNAIGERTTLGRNQATQMLLRAVLEVTRV